MNIKKSLFFFFLLSFSYAVSSVCYFIPPKNFEAADPRSLSKEVLIGFVGKSCSLKPSVNLASENTTASLREYINAIKESYKDDKKCFLRELGTIDTKSGKAFLIEISQTTSFADIRLMQAVLLKDNTAYVLTSCSSKEDFTKYQKEFLRCFNSLTVTSDLLDEIENKDEKLILEKGLLELKKNKNLSAFEKLLSHHDNLGAYWKILLLKKAYESIH